MAKKFYVVWDNGDVRLFDDWDDCDEYLASHPGSRCKGFNSKTDAIEAFRGDEASQLLLFKAISNAPKLTVNYAAFPEIHTDALAVDAACAKNPGPVEYQGVWVANGHRAFHIGPLEGGTNNIGEFLALVHALALFDREGRHDIPIYTDSQTALAWLRNRKAKTTLKPTAANGRILELLARAEAWLATHPVKNPIYKWNTDLWGEIPADFGRK